MVQEHMVMGMGEPVDDRTITLLERIAHTWENAKRSTIVNLRTRRWLRWGLVLIALGGVAASSVAISRSITAPASVCECPLKKEPPSAGKAQKGKSSAITSKGGK